MLKTINVEALIERFCSVASRRKLYEDVSCHGNIAFTPSDSDSWYSKTQKGKTTITYAPTDHPEASFAHELLHARLKYRGYRQYCTAVCLTEKRALVARILEILDDELQHHKFYRDFLALGFEPRQMYNDSDVKVWEELRQSIAALRSKDPLDLFFNSYVTIIAPGSAGDEDERKVVEKTLEAKCPWKYWISLNEIKNNIVDFGKATSLDAGPTIVRILRILGEYEPTWAGWNDEFPTSGYFIGSPFTAAEALRTTAALPRP